MVGQCRSGDNGNWRKPIFLGNSVCANAERGITAKCLNAWLGADINALNQLAVAGSRGERRGTPADRQCLFLREGAYPPEQGGSARQRQRWLLHALQLLSQRQTLLWPEVRLAIPRKSARERRVVPALADPGGVMQHARGA